MVNREWAACARDDAAGGEGGGGDEEKEEGIGSKEHVLKY